MLNNKDYYSITDFSLFENTSTSFLQSLQERMSMREKVYQEGDFIAMQGDVCRSLLFLCSGMVHAQMVGVEGKEIVIERLSAPELLAPAFIYGSNNYFPVSVIAQTTCRVVSIDRMDFLEMMHEEKGLMNNFMREISDRSQFLSKKLNEFALQSLQERLMGYIRRHKRIENIQEAAFILGVARPSLSRVLSALTDSGTLIKQGNGYLLKE